MENSISDIKELFNTLLEIDKPWKLSEICLRKEDKIVEAYIEFEPGTKFECPVCSAKSEVHDTRYRIWRHLDIMDYKLNLLIKIPRIKCTEHGVKTIKEIPWGRINSHFTHMLENFILHKAREMSVSAIGREIRENDSTLWRIIKYHVSKMKDEQIDFNNVHKICVDETSSRKGHKYVTIFTDSEAGKIIFVIEGKDSRTFESFYKELSSKDVHHNNIRNISMDMSPSFIVGAETYFPEAKVVFDKFHVKKLLNEAVDCIRREESKETESLRKTKYIWLKSKSKLTNKQREKLQELLENNNLKTSEAYRMKLNFDDLWNIDISKAEEYLREWCKKVLTLCLSSLNAFVKTIENHWQGIINITLTKLSNGISEGLNSIVQLAKSRARGFKNIDNFIDIIYLIGARFEY